MSGVESHGPAIIVQGLVVTLQALAKLRPPKEGLNRVGLLLEPALQAGQAATKPVSVNVSLSHGLQNQERMPMVLLD